MEPVKTAANGPVEFGRINKVNVMAGLLEARKQLNFTIKKGSNSFSYRVSFFIGKAPQHKIVSIFSEDLSFAFALECTLVLSGRVNKVNL